MSWSSWPRNARGGGITERFVRRSARHLVVSPDVLQSAAIDPNEVADRLSAAYLIATKVVLVGTHLLAAAIIIPTLSHQLTAVNNDR